jgi:hypothetical protein
MRKPAYIALERLNNLRYLWGEFRIFLLELWIFPVIMAWIGIQIQLPLGIEGILPSFISTNQLLPRIGSSPSKGPSKHYNTPQ